MRTYKPFTVSLDPGLIEFVEMRRKQLGFKKSTYIQQLLYADVRAWKAEKDKLDRLLEEAKKATPPKRSPRKRRSAGDAISELS